MALTYRRAVLADAAQIMGIWNQNVAPTRLYWPGSVESMTLAAAKAMITDPLIGVYVSDVAGVLTGFLFTFKRHNPESEEISSITMRLDDLTGSAANKVVKWVKRLRADGKGLMLAWLQDARARGIADCWGDMPLGAPAGILKFFDDMLISAADSGGKRHYHADPATAIAAMGRVV